MYKNGKPNYNECVFTQEQLENIKELYLSGVSSVKIGKMYGTDHKPILRVLHKMNVDVCQKRLVRKYTLDEHYFDNIDTQEKAYIFGFLLADGHNEKEIHNSNVIARRGQLYLRMHANRIKK